MITNIYNETLTFITALNCNLEEFKKDPEKFYENWDENWHASDTRYEHPIIDGNSLREMTREEKILNLNMSELLQDGEYIENGEILIVECPESILRKAWDKENRVWYETMTKEEIVEVRANKILEYQKLVENKNMLEASKFTSTDEISFIVVKMNNLEIEINNLGNKIETFKI